MRADDKTFHMSVSHNTKQKTVIDYFNGAKKKTHQGMLLIGITCDNVFPLMIPSFYTTD